MHPDSFQAGYCQRMAVALPDYRASLLRRTVYPHTRPFLRLLARLDRQYFQADYEFIDDMGHLHNSVGFPEAVDCYVAHYSNRSFLRRRLRLGVSVRRMWRLVAEVLHADAPLRLRVIMRGPDSLAPFGSEGSHSGAESEESAWYPSI